MKSPARTRWRVLTTAAALVAATLIPQLAAGTANAAYAPGRTAASSAVPHYQHIAVVLYTDHGYSQVIGNKFAPTINSLAKQYGLASHYFSTSDPDAADIMAMLTGKTFSVNDGLPTGTSSSRCPACSASSAPRT
jgi:fructose/tagatose bisphosphate aldolase